MPSNTANRDRWRIGWPACASLLVFGLLAAITWAVVLPWHIRAIRQEAAVVSLTAKPLDNEVLYQGDLVRQHDSLPVQEWLRAILRNDHFRTVYEVRLDEADDEEIRMLENFPELKVLHVFSGIECTERGLERLRSLQGLRMLSLSNTPAAGDGLALAISTLKDLHELHLECGSDHISDLGVEYISRLSNLKALTLECGTNVTPRGLSQLSRLAKLEQLTLHFPDSNESGGDAQHPVDINDASGGAEVGDEVCCISSLGKMKRLTLRGSAALRRVSSSCLAKLRNLEILEVQSDDKLRDKDFAALGRMQSLRSLLVDCEPGNETDAGISELTSLLKLAKLELRLGIAVSDSGIASLKACPSLQRLRLHLNDRVVGDGLASLTGVKYLELRFESRTADAEAFRLRVPPSLEDLVVHGPPGLSDEDLSSLAAAMSLYEIDLWRCDGITSAGIRQLVHLKGLKELGLYWCKHFPDSELADASLALPACKVKILNGGGGFGFSSRF